MEYSVGRLGGDCSGYCPSLNGSNSVHVRSRGEYAVFQVRSDIREEAGLECPSDRSRTRGGGDY